MSSLLVFKSVNKPHPATQIWQELLMITSNGDRECREVEGLQRDAPHRALCELTQLAEWYIEGKKSIWTLKVKIRHRTVVW